MAFSKRLLILWSLNFQGQWKNLTSLNTSYVTWWTCPRLSGHGPKQEPKRGGGISLYVPKVKKSLSVELSSNLYG